MSFCPSCGAAILAREAKFCVSCGAGFASVPLGRTSSADRYSGSKSVAAPTALTLEASSHGPTILARWKIVGVTLVTMAISLIACKSDPDTPGLGQEVNPSAHKEAEALTRPVKSSGRLPRGLYGIMLSDTYDEVTAKDPELKIHGTGSKASAELIALSVPSNGYFRTVIIKGGRASQIAHEMDGISPSDADAFQDGVLLRFGKPDSVVERDPRETVWVWNDGDVIVKFTKRTSSSSHDCPSTAYSVDLAIVNWPEAANIDAANIGSSEFFRKSTALARDWWAREWAQPASTNVTTKPLPREYAGIQLGQDMSEAGALFPGMSFKTDVITGEIIGELNDGEWGNLAINCWQGRIYEISQFRTVPEADVEVEGQQLLTRWFGPPTVLIVNDSTALRLVDVTWMDARTSFQQSVQKAMNGPGAVFVALIDSATENVKEEAERATYCTEHPTDHYQRIPEGMSLF